MLSFSGQLSTLKNSYLMYCFPFLANWGINKLVFTPEPLQTPVLGIAFKPIGGSFSQRVPMGVSVAF